MKTTNPSEAHEIWQHRVTELGQEIASLEQKLSGAMFAKKNADQNQETYSSMAAESGEGAERVIDYGSSGEMWSALSKDYGYIESNLRDEIGKKKQELEKLLLSEPGEEPGQQ